MITKEFKLYDNTRDREVPVILYLSKANSNRVIIFNPGYQSQEELLNPDELPAYKGYRYLVDYFSNNGYNFVSIQHDILGDKDGLEILNPKAVQSEERKHLWVRGQENVHFVINELQKRNLGLNFDKFIIAGHSNGGDIAKYFANNNKSMIECMILFDARRCPIKSSGKILMFEANDTITDIGVIPEKLSDRRNLDLIIIKPKNATHVG